MLYRFRESQAVEMGMGDRQKGDRRPRMASSVTNLRDCERWRGDILRDISRKVSKIQDGESSPERAARGEGVGASGVGGGCGCGCEGRGVYELHRLRVPRGESPSRAAEILSFPRHGHGEESEGRVVALLSERQLLRGEGRVSMIECSRSSLSSALMTCPPFCLLCPRFSLPLTPQSTLRLPCQTPRHAHADPQPRCPTTKCAT